MVFNLRACLPILAALVSVVALALEPHDPHAFDGASDDAVPFPAFPASDFAGESAVAGFLSATLGDNMVLQREPQSAVIWGHTTPGATVTTSFDSKVYTATAGADGVWRQALPPMPASMRPYNISVRSSRGQAAELREVLFGDIFLCGGQSNMQFSMGAVANASQEAARADGYPHIRLFTVGQKTRSSVPLGDLQTVEQRWSVASRTSIAGSGSFGHFSAVCWFFGREISDAMAPGQKTPIGLISNNWGGTKIELWSTGEGMSQCHKRATSGALYNAMIHPYVVGPMALAGFTWYQGEANVGDAASYACLFPAMISAWRKAFRNPDAYFGFVQLSTWCANPDAIASMRDAQMSAMVLPNVGYATNADHGAGCNIHPPPKQFCGKRLGDSALALHYGREVAWRSPAYASASAATVALPGKVVALVELSDVGAGGLELRSHPYNQVAGLDCGRLDAAHPGTCAWASVQVEGGAWLNATASVAADGRVLLLEAPVPGDFGSSAPKVLATSYGWGAVPMLTAYDRATGLPVLPWKKEVAQEGAGQLGLLVV